MRGKEVVLTISDLQAPFQHKDTMPFLSALKKKYKPTKIVCMGDEEDQHALSEYDKDPDGHSAGREHELAIEFLQSIYKMFPVADVCISNHTDRVFRKAYKHGIPRAYFKEYRDFLEAPKTWRWSDYFEIDGVRYTHGEGFSGRNGAISCADANMQSTVIGHIHAFAGIQWSANPRYLYFGLNTGCLIDVHAYAFRYGKHMKHKPIIGTGLVVEGLPVFVPMLLDKHSRWVGKL